MKVLGYIKRLVAVLSIVMILMFSGVYTSFADDVTDEIINFTITADVNEDATVNLQYHIEWKVLESDGIGPLSWANIGIPNGNYVEYTAESDSIEEMEYSGENGSTLKIYLDKDYYEGETVTLDFTLVQDYMYAMNMAQEGYTTYEFTPAWFDSANVDNLTIRWNADKVSSWYPSAVTVNGYNEWTFTPSLGERKTISVTYPNEAFTFDESKWVMTNNEGDDYEWEDSYGMFVDSAAEGIISIVSLIITIVPIIAIISSSKSYTKKSGFGEKKQVKITHTRVKYFASCPGCGSVRGDGQTVCDYCGHSFVESEEIVKEEDLSEAEKKMDKDGEFACEDPNTFMRVHVAYIPIPRSSSHRSCACAHSSCACACACACASSGRAGCSTKDFYNTKLKLKSIEMLTKAKKHK